MINTAPVTMETKQVLVVVAAGGDAQHFDGETLVVRGAVDGESQTRVRLVEELWQTNQKQYIKSRP